MQIFKELHSEQINDIISTPPKSLIRWGMSLFLGICILLMLSTFYVSYPEVVKADIIITASTGSRAIITPIEGRLEKLYVHDGDHIGKNEILAYLENTADYNEVLRLKLNIDSIKHLISNTKWVEALSLKRDNFVRLGEIQVDYELFEDNTAEFKSHMINNTYLQKRAQFIEEAANAEAKRKRINEQRTLSRQHYDLNISLRDFKKGYIRSLNTLFSSIEKWEKMYILKAPVAGSISFSRPMVEQQHLKYGEELLKIEPISNTIQGIISIPQESIGKLTAGQKVLIKLHAYPYKEYGVVEGRLNNLSSIPNLENHFWGNVALPKKLTTSFGHNIRYRNGLKGSAEIITAERSLADRIFNIRKLENR